MIGITFYGKISGKKQTERVRELKERFSQNVLKLNQKISLFSVLVTKFNYLG